MNQPVKFVASRRRNQHSRRVRYPACAVAPVVSFVTVVRGCFIKFDRWLHRSSHPKLQRSPRFPCAISPAAFYFYMRELEGNVPQSLAGSFLVAHPNMQDPNFRRTVLFISSHDPEEGAFGVILNRPLDKHVSELVSEPINGLEDVPVYIGGPVGRAQLMFAAFEWRKGEGLR